MLWLSLGVVVDPGMLLLKAVEDPVKLLPMRGSLTVGPSRGPLQTPGVEPGGGEVWLTKNLPQKEEMPPER